MALKWQLITETEPACHVAVLLWDGGEGEAILTAMRSFDGTSGTAKKGPFYWIPYGFDGHEWDWDVQPDDCTHFLRLGDLENLEKVEAGTHATDG